MFDERFLHRTYLNRFMTEDRDALECWFFAPSHYSTATSRSRSDAFQSRLHTRDGPPGPLAQDVALGRSTVPGRPSASSPVTSASVRRRHRRSPRRVTPYSLYKSTMRRSLPTDKLVA
jgi:hypothetical protein